MIEDTENMPSPLENTYSGSDNATSGFVDTTSGSTAISPQEYTGAMTFTSIRGYTIYFEKGDIAYQGTIIDHEEFGLELSGVTCMYAVKVINHADKTQLSTDPDIEIFECTINDIPQTQSDIA